MAKRITENDKVRTLQVYDKHYRISRQVLARLNELGLVKWSGYGKASVTDSGMALIQPELDERFHQRVEVKTKQGAFEADKKSREDEVYRGLASVGCTRLAWVRLIPQFNGDRKSQLIFDIGFYSCMTLRQSVDTGRFMMYTRSSDEPVSVAAITEEAQQAQIACDYLNSKLAEAAQS